MYDKRYAKQLCDLLQERFYQSKPWRSTRKHALLIYGAKCHCCGAKPSKRKPLHVDHIRPRSNFPDLALCMTNLQLLCERCNISKSNTKIVDYRSEEDKMYATMYNRGTNVHTILIEQKTGVLKPRVVNESATTLVASQDVVVQNNKKKNPNTVKDTRTKKQKRKQAEKFRSIQQQFLETVRTLTTSKDVTEFVNKCEVMLGIETTKRLVALCNVSHKLDR